MATLDPSEIMFTPFEPKVKNRFIMYIEGVPAYLVKTAKRPSIEFEEITLDLNKWLERMILINPGQWIWSHNRWK